MAGTSHAALGGSITPIVTPFKKGAVDYDRYAELLDFQIRSGGHGVLVNGTTAEPSTLTLEERNKLVDVAVETVGSRTLVVAATGSQSLAETQLLSEHAARAGVDAVLVVTPYYICPPQRGLVAYYEEIGRISATPLLMYHIPGRTAVSVTVDTLAEIKTRIPHFVGMKHAVNDLGFVTRVLARLGADFRIFVGLEELSFPMLAIGASGLMNAVGNLVPGKVARLYDVTAAGHMEAARRLHFELYDLNSAVFFDTNPQPLKYMMMRMGLLETNEHRLPMMPVDAPTAARLDVILKQSGLITTA